MVYKKNSLKEIPLLVELCVFVCVSHRVLHLCAHLSTVKVMPCQGISQVSLDPFSADWFDSDVSWYC